MFRPGQQVQTSGNVMEQAQQPQGDRLTYPPAISNIGALPFPLEAVLDQTGESVTLLQTCDWAGHSPSNIGVDRKGKQFIAAFEELTVTDQRAVPNQQAVDIRNRQAQLSTGQGTRSVR